MANLNSVISSTAIDAKATDVNSSAFRSAAWRSQSTAWTLTGDLWQSPLYIREKETEYLEKFRGEHAQKYAERLRRSVPRNRFRETIETMAGMVFKADPSPQDVPSELRELFTDIDACGNSLHSFLLLSFEKFLRDGGGAFWVNSTPLNDSARAKAETGVRLSAADRLGERPFWEWVDAAQIINYRYDKINGIDVLSQVTIERDELEPRGMFGEESVKRHYILRPGTYEVRRFDKEKGEWLIEQDEVRTGLSIVPLYPVAPFGTTPPLLDLAMLTIQFYNKISDFDEWCHNACVPERVYNFNDKSDAEEATKLLKASASTATIMWGQHGKAYWNEVSGSGLDVAKDRLADLSAEMSAIGVGMLAATQIAPRSATEVLDTAGQRQSKLARYAREFENTVEKAFYGTAEILQSMGRGVDLLATEGVSLKLTMDFDRLTFSPERAKLFESLLSNGDLSRRTFFELLEKMEDMPEGWSPEVELERLRGEESEIDPVINARLLPSIDTDAPLIEAEAAAVNAA